MSALTFQLGDTIPVHVGRLETAQGDVVVRAKKNPAKFTFEGSGDWSPGWGPEDTSHPVSAWLPEMFPLTALEGDS